MRDKLISYVDLLFAGAPDSGDIRQEILQNTLDRYDDLVAQGKSEQAAYQLAISGIGDINELLGNADPAGSAPASPEPNGARGEKSSESTYIAPWKKVIRAIGIFLYIICPIPLFVLSEMGMDTIGLCGTISIVAIATALMVISGGKHTVQKQENHSAEPENELNRAVGSLIGILGLCLYLVVSFATGAWHITWIIFPILGAVKGLIKACIDLKEASKNEK